MEYNKDRQYFNMCMIYANYFYHRIGNGHTMHICIDDIRIL